MSKTFRLFKVIPDFFLGIASIIDLGGTIDVNNYDNTPSDADYNAIASDWNMVGEDMKQAVMRYQYGE